MKQFGFLFVLFCVLISCSSDNERSEYPQKWILTKITGQLADSEVSGQEMEWQEYYYLNANGTFKKTRERDGKGFEAKGSYEYIDENGERFLKLKFQDDSEIIGSCYGDQTEYLWIVSDTKMQGTWLACDGPGLEYERIE